MRKIILIFIVAFAINFIAHAQPSNLYTSYTTSQSRAHLYRNLLNTINKNLSRELNDSSEDYWQQAFLAIELLGYKQPWIEKKVEHTFDSITTRSPGFQVGLLELINANYPFQFIPQAQDLLKHSDNTRIFSIAAAYILRELDTEAEVINALLVSKFAQQAKTDPVLIMLQAQINALQHPGSEIKNHRLLKDLFSKNFLPGNIVLYSLQRKNRDFPGIAIIRNANGEFLQDSLGNLFSVPQLARSISGLPAYISNGNTPQGIFRMTGFDVSSNNFIGPTPNIQLKLPFEINPQKFLKDSLFTDTVWEISEYKKLLPKNLQNYLPLYNTYYAGQAGRTEIIAHGTTVNPDYYKNTSYYPHTPSQGCLSTKETWNGKLIQSDQQQLVYALLRAGGANGYCVVVEIDDKDEPVSQVDVLPLLPATSSK
ncbi:MAG: hypothetical protein ABJA57_04105 [Ginsengibacter sp.]